jgi:hypothetical protein
MTSLSLLAVMLLSACVNKPKRPNDPKYVYMIMFGNKLRAYPVNPVDSEFTTGVNTQIGAMCLPVDDWSLREKYILDLESYVESN